MQSVGQFVVLDYVLFIGVIVLSLGVGIFYALREGKKRTAKEYLVGGRQMPITPVTLSLLASFMSAITLLGTPAEIYRHGTQFVMICVAYLLMLALASHVYVPVFYKLEVTSVFEYLELRFARCVRTSASCICILQMTIYLAMVLYEPCLALAAVTGLNVWATVFVMGISCSIYTSIGGLKAVIWTDAFQIVLMFGAIFAVIIPGINLGGGFANIWQNAIDGGRLELFNMDPNPTTRHTFWSLSIGGCFNWAAIYAVNQAQVQRALSCPSLRNAQIAMWLNFPGLVILMLACALCGLILFSVYGHCDPLSTGLINASDELMPLFVMQYLPYPGLPGLFVAGLFSGALSTLSSGFNALAAIILRDIVRNHFVMNMSDERETLVSKLIAGGFGILCTVLTLPVSTFGQLLTAALGVFGSIGGPLLGVFTLGMFLPQANWKGAMIALWTVLAFLLWITAGFYFFKPDIPDLPLYTDQCNFNGSASATSASTTFLPPVISSSAAPAANYLSIYGISYLWYSLIAVIGTLVIGFIVSWLSGMHRAKDVDPRLLCPPIAALVKKLYGTAELYLISPDDCVGGSITRSLETINTQVTDIAFSRNEAILHGGSDKQSGDIFIIDTTATRRPPRPLSASYTSTV